MNKFILGLLLTLSFDSCLADSLANANNSGWYYRIGGARSISLPPNVSVQTMALNSSFEYGLGYSCGNFDPTLGLTNLLNSLEGAGNNLINGAIGAVQAAIGGIPALIMQRIDPGLYDLFQNAVIRAEAMLSLANRTCEDYEQQIKQGINPYAEWTDLSKVIDWKVQMGTGGYGSSNTDVVTAKKNVQTSNGDNGLPWVGGTKAGGKHMQPIKATADVVKAGYNITLNRSVDDQSAPNFSNNGGAPRRLVQVFETPADASRWAVDVVGDVHIRTDSNHPNETIPGHGLLPKIEKRMNSTQQKLTGLVAGNIPLTLENLNTVSSNAVLINSDVIKAIRSLKPGEKAMAISKLASESAMAKVVEKAMIIRRMLITGSREPNVAQTPAGIEIEESIARLDRDINDILYERKIHNELASQTPLAILELNEQYHNQARVTTPAAGSEESIMDTGAIDR